MGQGSTSAGPNVRAVQPKFPQNNNGSKGATYDEIVDFHFKSTRAALDALAAKGESADLVIWSETMMPELNEIYRQYMHEFVTREDKRNVGETLDTIYDQLGSFARTFSTNLLVGGHTMLPERPVNGKKTWARRNSA